MTAARVSIKTGTVPTYHSFVKHIWSYRDERGHTALCPPPEVFTLIIDDPADALMAVTAVELLAGPLGFHGRIVARSIGGSIASIGFSDLQVLHAFLESLSVQEPPAAREVAQFCLEMLGFSWA